VNIKSGALNTYFYSKYRIKPLLYFHFANVWTVEKNDIC
jgi:hypothetical protein